MPYSDLESEDSVMNEAAKFTALMEPTFQLWQSRGLGKRQGMQKRQISKSANEQAAYSMG